MELLAQLVVAGVVLWVVWRVCQPRYAFVVRVADGLPMAVQGTVTAAFLEQLREVCNQHGIRKCTVRGVIRAGRISLVFSRDIPPPGQQQLRNWWVLSGWSVRKHRA